MEGLRLEKDVWVSTAPLTSLAGEGEEQDLKAEISCVLQSSEGANCHESRSFLVTKPD